MSTKMISEPMMMDAVLHRLGDVSPNRVCMKPYPGKATVEDVIHFQDKYNRNFELYDGVMLEKVMGFSESIVMVEIVVFLKIHLAQFSTSGIVIGADGPIQLFGGQVRMPDVAYISRDRLPDGEVPDAKVPRLVPNIAVEVLSEGNTPREMEKKLEEYLTAGVELVWYVDPESRTVMVYRPDATSTLLKSTDDLTGEVVLPGFRVAVADLFKSLPKKPGKNKKR